MTSIEKDIRIVVPAYNADANLVNCLDAILDAISFSNSWEIFIVDNGQNTNLQKVLEKYPVTVLKCYETNSAAYARNEGAKGFLKSILVFIDSDVICESNCIEQLIKPIQKGICHATIGNYSLNLTGLTFSQKYKQLYINHIYNREGTKIKNDFWTAISSVSVEVFNKLNGFNPNIKGANGEDQEFGIRLTKNGFKVLSVKQANGQHRNPYGIRRIIRNDFKKGITAIQNSLSNKVRLTDNRHAGKADISAVLFSTTTVCFLLLGLFHADFLFVAIILVALWLLSRIKLSITFLKTEGLLFCFRALALMFILDLVRFNCVIVGIIKTKLLNKSVEEKILQPEYN